MIDLGQFVNFMAKLALFLDPNSYAVLLPRITSSKEPVLPAASPEATLMSSTSGLTRLLSQSRLGDAASSGDCAEVPLRKLSQFAELLGLHHPLLVKYAS